MKLESYLKEEVIDITKKLRGSATDSFINKVLTRAENDIGWTIDFYEKDNNRKMLKRRVISLIKDLSYLERKLK